MLHEITTKWDHDDVLDTYRQEYIDDEDISRYFYYNQSTLRVETINVNDEGKRYIVPINDVEDIGNIIPHYANVYITSNGIPDVFKGKEGIIRYNGINYLVVNADINVELEFMLYNITTPWNVEDTIEQYKIGYIGRESLSQWFYYNLNTCNVETVNVDDRGNRYIAIISDLDELINTLPQYINAYLNTDILPKICLGKEGIVTHRGFKYLVIKPNPKNDLDYLDDIPNEYKDIMQYIRSNSFVVVPNIEARWYVNNGGSGYRGLLSYLSGHSVMLVHASIPIEIGQLVRCKTHSNKLTREQTCYFYYTGTIPEGIKLPRAFYNKV